ncbi:MFS transporter [Streptomyces sp. Tue 6430]|nr:MFS transporter [Streptomyces sp. Tue 6430]
MRVTDDLPGPVPRPGLRPAVALNLVSAFGIMGSAYFTTQYLQSVLGKSALEAALWALLPSVPIGVAAPVATGLVRKGVDRAHVVTAGFVIAASGFGLLALAGTDAMWLVLASCAVLAVGSVVVMSQIMDLAMGAAPVERAGAASSLMETGSEFGGALGMAVLGSVGTAVYRHEIPAAAPDPARETLGGALAVADRVPGLATAAREAFTSGMQGAAVTGAVLLAGAAVLAAVTLRRAEVHERARERTRGQTCESPDRPSALGRSGEA